MGRQALKLGGVLIGMYLLVAYATGSGKVISTTTSGGVGLIKALQGR